jgi:hypothetical protein
MKRKALNRYSLNCLAMCVMPLIISALCIVAPVCSQKAGSVHFRFISRCPLTDAFTSNSVVQYVKYRLFGFTARRRLFVSDFDSDWKRLTSFGRATACPVLRGNYRQPILMLPSAE